MIFSAKIVEIPGKSINSHWRFLANNCKKSASAVALMSAVASASTSACRRGLKLPKPPESTAPKAANLVIYLTQVWSGVGREPKCWKVRRLPFRYAVSPPIPIIDRLNSWEYRLSSCSQRILRRLGDRNLVIMFIAAAGSSEFTTCSP